jgi:hypothetical protein
MSWVSEIVAVVGGLTGIASAYVSWQQWQKTDRKIAMLSDAGKVAEILPAWYTQRMMQDHWLFGLLTATGQMIAIKRITSLSDDGKWMDVELADKDEAAAVMDYPLELVHAVAGDRRTASVQISGIVAAIELQTS